MSAPVVSRNAEIKVRLGGPGQLEQMAVRAAALGAAGPQRIDQDDTFFQSPSCRLKLRDFGDGTGELIAYRRADDPGARISEYRRTPTADPDGLRQCLQMALGLAQPVGRIRKRRELWLLGRTRIHLDDIEGLGPCAELEVVMRPGESAEAALQEAQHLLERLGLADAPRIAGAYLDLLRPPTRPEGPRD